MSSSVEDGCPPHGVVPKAKPSAGQWLMATVPYRSSCTALSSAAANLGSFIVDGWTITVADSVPHTLSLTNFTASSRNATGSAVPRVVSLMTEHHGSIEKTLSSALSESTSL